MPVGATLGAAVIGGGAAIASSRSQASAGRAATAAAQGTSDQQIAFYRDVFNQQRLDFEPFRQFDIQRLNFIGNIFGFDAVGQQAGAGQQGARTQQQLLGGVSPGAINAGTGFVGTQRPQRRQALDAFGGAQGLGVGQQAQPFAATQPDPAGPVGPGAEVIDFGGTPIPGVTPAGVPAPTDPAIPGGQPAVPGQTGQILDPSIRGSEIFDNTIFGQALRGADQQSQSAIDARLASQGVALSGANIEAQQNARVQNFNAVLGSALNLLTGTPTTSAAAQGQAQAGSQLAAGVGGSLGALGQQQSTSAFNRGQQQADLFGSLATAGGTALGAFSLGGKKPAGTKFPVGFA